MRILEPWIVQGDWGEDIDIELSTVLPLGDDAALGLALFTDRARHDLEAARATDLFETHRTFLGPGYTQVCANTASCYSIVRSDRDPLGALPTFPQEPTPQATKVANAAG